MTGFMNADGSSLIGALNPSNQGQALQVDSSGNLKVTGGGGSGGTVTVADPNTPANKLAVDSAGRLTLVPNQGFNLAQWNGAAPGVSNPVLIQDQLRYWIVNGQGYSATTGKQTAAGAITAGLSVFNPAASGKTLLLYSLTFVIGNNSFNQINFTSSDPALGSSAVVSNNRNGGAASIASCSYANSNLAVVGSTKEYAGAATNTFVQVLSNGNAYLLPAGSGIVFYTNVSGANVWLCSMAWIEM